MTTYYVSVTGLKLTGWWRSFLFWCYAIPSMAQARGTRGNIFADARVIGEMRHTLTVWEDQAAMKTFLRRGAHQSAVKTFAGMTTPHICGITLDYVPNWDEALELWRRYAVERKDNDPAAGLERHKRETP